jgi:hypothetical protein
LVCRQACRVFHITEAVAAAARARLKSLWQEVANASLHVLDINSAIAALREAGNASMVLSLERLRCTEDRYLLAGHVLALTEKDYDTAQVIYNSQEFPSVPCRRHASKVHGRMEASLSKLPYFATCELSGHDIVYVNRPGYSLDSL